MKKSSLYKALNESGSFSLEQWQKLGVEIMKNRPPEWDKVVEDTLIAEKTNDGLKMDGEKNSLTWLMGLYITGMNKSIPVRIKCRKGAILIERIGG